MEYICIVEKLLDNPVFNALNSGDEALSRGTELIKYFDEEVSPFAGFGDENENGFVELFQILPPGRKILYATPGIIKEPKGWQLVVEVKGLQFIYDNKIPPFEYSTPQLVQLNESNVMEMVHLAQLTKPGPFNSRTIEFGNYHGIFENNQLASMTGQRLHVKNYTEISAVCTHPDYLGKGYAALLLQHQLDLIGRAGQIPFLHVRDDNERAITLYKRLGFKIRGPMNFYFMQRKLK